MVGDMQHHQLSREEDSPARRVVVREFVAAVVAFSQDPGPENLERYLAASLALDDVRPLEPSRRERS
jgi:hypothetical protein